MTLRNPRGQRVYCIISSFSSQFTQTSHSLSLCVAHFLQIALLLDDEAASCLTLQDSCEKSFPLLSLFIPHCPQTRLLDALPLGRS